MQRLVDRLKSLRTQMLELEAACHHQLECIGDQRKPSARNLLHYVALRREDSASCRTNWDSADCRR